MPALRLSAVSLFLLLFLLSACWMQDTVPPTPAPPTPTPTITWANTPATPKSTPAPRATATAKREIVLFFSKFGQIDIGKTAITNGWRDGQLLAPTINLWSQPDGARSIRCSVSGDGSLVRVQALADDGIHALVASELRPDCNGWLHIDFLAPPDFPLPKL